METLETRTCLSGPTAYAGSPVALPVAGAWPSTVFNGSPIFADLNGDGEDELITPIAGGKLIAYTTDQAGNVTPFMVYDTGSSGNTMANIKATPVVVYDPAIGHDAIFAALGRNENADGTVEDGRIFGWDALTGQVLAGWPQSSGRFLAGADQGSGVTGPLTVADLLGDGNDEIVVTSASEQISAFRLDGSMLWTFNNGDSIESGAVVGDLYHDGHMEVVYASGISPGPFFAPGGQITILDGATGTAMYRSGALASNPANYVPEEFFSSVTLVDLDGTGQLDIVVAGGQHFSDPSIAGYSPAAMAAGNRIYAFDNHGNLLPGWPYHTTGDDTTAHNTWRDIASADLFQNGQNEIIDVDQAGYLHVVLPDGQAAPGWAGGKLVGPAANQPQSPDFATPIVADVNGDGFADIVVSQGPFLTAFDRFGNIIFSAVAPLTSGNVFPDDVDTAAAVGHFGNGPGLVLAFSTVAAAVSDAPSHLALYQLPSSTLTPPWPMNRRTASGDAVQNSISYEIQYVQSAYEAALGRAPSGAEYVPLAVALQNDTITASQVAQYLAGTNEARTDVVDRLFEAYLGVLPPDSAVPYFVNQLASQTEESLAISLMSTASFYSRGGSIPGLANLLYESNLGRAPTTAELNATVSQIQAGVPASVIGANLLNSPEGVAVAFTPFYRAIGIGSIPADSLEVFTYIYQHGGREEAIEASIVANQGNYAATNPLANFIRSIYRDALFREATPAEVAQFFPVLASGALDPTTLVNYLLNSAEGHVALVTQDFERYLGRAPSAGELAQFAGYTRREDVGIALVGSNEFYQDSGGTVAGFVQAAYSKVAYFATLDSTTLNNTVQLVNTTLGRSGLVKLLFDGQEIVEDFFHYLPNEAEGVLRNGTLAGGAINPDPTELASFTNAYQAGVPEETLIAQLMTQPQYFAKAVYEEGFYRSRGIRN